MQEIDENEIHRLEKIESERNIVSWQEHKMKAISDEEIAGL